MPESFEIFVESLGLRPAEAANLEAELARESQTNATSPVCIVAQRILGSEVVDTAPLNQTAVDANWCVRPSIHTSTTTES